MFRRFAVVAVAAAFSLTACGQSGQNPAAGEPEAATRTVSHAQGTTEVSGTPERIVVIDYGSLDTLKALGLGDKVVGTPKQGLPTWLGEFADEKYADVGTLQEPNLEAINEADPDLVIVGSRAAAKYPELSQHWPTLDTTYAADKGLIEGTETAAQPIAQAFGKEAELGEQVRELEAKADEVSAQGGNAGKGLILMTSGGKISLHGPNSRFGAVHKLLGVPMAKENITEDRHGEPATFELLADINPEIMFVVDRDAAIGREGQNARAILDNELVHRTTAWQNDDLVMLDGSRWYVAAHGLDNVEVMLDEVADGIQS